MVDDGSTDESSRICDKQIALDSRLAVIHKSNGGLSDARNVALDITTGEYIGYVDSDDYVDHDYFEMLFRNMQDYNADISACRYAKVYDNGKRIPVGEDHKVYIYSGYESLKEYLYGKTLDPFVWNKLYRAIFTRQTSEISGFPIRFIKGIVGEDNPFNIKIMKSKPRVILCGESKYNYLQARIGAITCSGVSQKKIDSVLWWETIRQECRQKYPDLEIYALRRQVIFYIGLYNLVICQHHEDDALKCQLRQFLTQNLLEIISSSHFELLVKMAAWFLVKWPYGYTLLMRAYKRIHGEIKL